VIYLLLVSHTLEIVERVKKIYYKCKLHYFIIYYIDSIVITYDNIF
jgi:hypothetical protein